MSSVCREEGCSCAVSGIEARLKRFKEVGGDGVDFEWQQCVSVFLIKKGVWRLARHLS